MHLRIFCFVFSKLMGPRIYHSEESGLPFLTELLNPIQYRRRNYSGILPLEATIEDSNGVIRNGSCLSGHFWKHTGVGANAPQWFIALLQASGQRSSPVLSTQHESRESSDGIGPSLEFLYPQQAQTLVASRLPRSQNRTGFRRRHLSFSRSYVSLSSLCQAPSEASSRHEYAPKLAQVPQNPESLHKDGEASASLQAFLQENGSEFDKAWVLYVAAGCPSKLKSALCAYMSKSPKKKDQRRAWTLFNEIAPKDRTDLDFKNIIKSQILSLPENRPQHLEEICQEAISTPFAQEIISLGLMHMMANRQWSKIISLWKKLLATRANERPPLDFFLDRFDRFHFPDYSLSRHLLAFTAHLISAGTVSAAANDFLRRLIERFISSDDMVISTPIPTLLELLHKCRPLSLPTTRHYFNLIQVFLQSEQRPELVKCILVYRYFRSRFPDERMHLTTIRAITQRVVKFKMTDSMLYFLDEEAHFDENKRPSMLSYNEAMSAFSRIGDVRTVQHLFDRFLADHGHPKFHGSVTPLLAVHARLGDVRETRRQFERIPTEFGLPVNTICWNILLLAYTTAKDLSGALSLFSEMRENKVPFNSYTFGTLMAIFAQRGDVEAIRQLLKEAQKSRVQITRPMIETAVQAYCKNGQLAHAEELIALSWDLAVGGSPLRMWNFLLMRYAFRVSKFSFRRVLDRMGRLGLKPDDMTYAAVMLAYVYAKQVNRAQATLRKMHEAGFQVTEHHYSILLLGYVKERNRDMVYVISREMQKRFGRIGMEESLLSLRMQIARDVETAKDLEIPIEDIVLENAEKTLAESISRFNANPSPANSRLSRPLEGFAVESFTATHYQRLIDAYGIVGGARKALETFTHYMQLRRTAGLSDGDDLKSLPIDFVKAVMNAFSETQNYEKVEECWNSIIANANKAAGTCDLDKILSAPSPESTLPASDVSSLPSIFSMSTQAEKPKIIPAQRFILDYPLSLYLQSLARRGMFAKMHQVVAEVQAAGFALTGFNWSTYVRTLATSDHYPDNVEAFRLFEEKFIVHFPGWSWFLKGYGVRPLNAPVTILHLEGRAGITKSRRMMGKLARKHWRKIDPGYMHPHYPTMVQLASTLQQLRQTSITEGNEHLANLYKIAPQTVDALAAMPTVADKYQGSILRGKAAKRDILPRPTHLSSSHSGALGPSRDMHERTFDDATKEPLVLRKDQHSEPAVNNLNLTGLLAVHEEGLFGPLASILPREDRVDLETTVHEYRVTAQQWKDRIKHYHEVIAMALKDRDIPRADAHKRRLVKLLYSDVKSPTAKRQLFDKDNRKWKLQTPPYLMFKPIAGLHVKPGRTLAKRASVRQRYKGPWTPREDQGDDR
ncbi:hypothetical protein DTO006G1_3288 [Penicillium roqueforti]|uniref:uncharacterized protein n=1 Tax=Penicillium roqueforti TaxID=5082 RepID=UPI0019095D74|nr:uncharacterized protein LCP9604111_6242 [Penicillium roqueforti]KAF9247543.1 hypothetical protein LCP9604111_6242 [Penicillium roqueforti]KAI1834883.1 hypothetical protein CBS147337_4437 [Penicillium roqueforti]KAI2676724.1 hypothetical protein CBS147355_5826 [Penicillium roqueforti]KAI2683599.1 hypothetical protein LCP963914a_6000 [Penicillium roqueforti]KAI2703041.1 hypothetical protein CBS147372_3356 [Penicillium roqueforti]